ncbi:primosomal protein N' [Actinomyces gaoshouyii]|uniref:Probable replication restart protein PriA n=1 Tax=Actinomyces gaoshouyii TaxID=1960083 RepID=A0A8H9HB98_9ACTO|nr:primosomal protein N' [Actinomyces gaoshouyii]GGO97919.1 putative primosomal protein N' [Actinomyces gaoshouyii]
MTDTAQQGELIAAPARPERTITPPDGVIDPVARVLLDTPVAHLDRLFDYRVPAAIDADARVGTRVAVRFGGQEAHGWIWERGSTTTHPGALTPVRRVVSDLPVLTPATMRLAESVAERSAGARPDVLRVAIPPRHARAEASAREGPAPVLPQWLAPEGGGWAVYEGGEKMLRSLADGGAPRSVVTVLPGRQGITASWPELLADAARAALSAGRGVLVLVATAEMAEDLASALTALLPGEPVVTLAADHGPARRYRAFARLLLGRARVVVGTRGAAFAPVADLGLAVIWDDGDDRLDERHAPYAHARTVLALRSSLEHCGLLIASHARSVEAQAYVERGWAASLAAPRSVVRAAAPRVEVPGVELEAEGASGAARFPSFAHRAVRAAVEAGPVLIQVPRGGYAPLVACDRCRAPARCTTCGGPMTMERGGAMSCRWCGRSPHGWRCENCGSDRLRMRSVGSARTGEELGRAFPGVGVVISGAREDHGVIAEVDDSPRLVVATPGAEPIAQGGYRAVILMDAGALSSRVDMGATVEAVRRWTNAAALVAPGARVIVLGGPEPVAAQHFLRWDHEGFARRELAEREELHLPPAWRTARLDGPRRAVEDLLMAGQAEGYEALGPVEAPRAGAGRAKDSAQASQATHRGVLRVPVPRGRELAGWLRHRLRDRSAHREDPIRVELDPTHLW